VHGAAVLEDTKPPGGNIAFQAMIEHDDAIGDILFQPLACQRGFAPLSGDDGGYAFLLEPAEQAPYFGAYDKRTAQGGEERLDRIQHHAPRADGINREPQTNEKAFQVILARLLDLRSIDMNVIDRQGLLGHQSVQIMAKGGRVRSQLFRAFFEGHIDALLLELLDAMNQELHGQERLAATGAPAYQCRPSPGQAPASNLVKPRDAGGALFNTSCHNPPPLLLNRVPQDSGHAGTDFSLD